ncbi:hypothetical protein NMY22_g12256 [Coprinellus aureogranulatus]|nr:hypothetical protein NMY22_g12256 [Coprinellus aureogranulatus]
MEESDDKAAEEETSSAIPLDIPVPDRAASDVSNDTPESSALPAEESKPEAMDTFVESHLNIAPGVAALDNDDVQGSTANAVDNGAEREAEDPETLQDSTLTPQEDAVDRSLAVKAVDDASTNVALPSPPTLAVGQDLEAGGAESQTTGWSSQSQPSRVQIDQTKYAIDPITDHASPAIDDEGLAVPAVAHEAVVPPPADTTLPAESDAPVSDVKVGEHEPSTEQQLLADPVDASLTSTIVEAEPALLAEEAGPEMDDCATEQVNVISSIPHIEPLNAGDDDSSNKGVDIPAVPLVDAEVAQPPDVTEHIVVPISEEDAELEEQHESASTSETLEAQHLPPGIEHAIEAGSTPSAEALLDAVQSSETAKEDDLGAKTAPPPIDVGLAETLADADDLPTAIETAFETGLASDPEALLNAVQATLSTTVFASGNPSPSDEKKEDEVVDAVVLEDKPSEVKEEAAPAVEGGEETHSEPVTALEQESQDVGETSVVDHPAPVVEEEVPRALETEEEPSASDLAAEEDIPVIEEASKNAPDTSAPEDAQPETAEPATAPGVDTDVHDVPASQTPAPVEDIPATAEDTVDPEDAAVATDNVVDDVTPADDAPVAGEVELQEGSPVAVEDQPPAEEKGAAALEVPVTEEVSHDEVAHEASAVEEDKRIVEEAPAPEEQVSAVPEEYVPAGEDSVCLADGPKESDDVQVEDPAVAAELPVAEAEQPLVEDDERQVEQEKATVPDDTAVVEEEPPVVDAEPAKVEGENSVVAVAQAPSAEVPDVSEKSDEQEQPAVEAEDAVPTVEEQPVEDEKPVVGEEATVAEEELPPVEEEKPVAEEAGPVAEETPVIEESPVVEDEPLNQKKPVIEENSPAIEEGKPASEEGEVVVEDKAVVDEDKASEEEKPTTEEPSVVEEDKPIVEDKPLVEEESAVEVEPPAEEDPATELDKSIVEDDPAAEEKLVSKEEAPVAQKVVVEEETPVAEKPILGEEEPAAVEKEGSVLAENHVAEEVPVTEEEKPAVKEETSAVGEAPTAEEEKPIAEDGPDVQEEVPVAEDKQEKPIAEVPSVKEEKPVVEEDTPAAEEEKPIAEDAPIVEEDKPVTSPRGEDPVVEEDRPVIVEEESTAEEQVPAIEEEKPSDEVKPVVEEEEPVAVPKPLVEEGGTSAVGEDKPIPEEKKPITDTVAPVVEEETSALTAEGASFDVQSVHPAEDSSLAEPEEPLAAVEEAHPTPAPQPPSTIIDKLSTPIVEDDDEPADVEPKPAATAATVTEEATNTPSA